MGLDWCIQTPEGSKTSPCQIVKAKKVGELFSREEYIKNGKDHYKKEYLELLKTDDAEWEKQSKKYSCDNCPGDTTNICSRCPEGSFACAAFGQGGCNFRGKVTVDCLDSVGFNGSVCFGHCKTEENWKRLIAEITRAIEHLQTTEQKEFKGWTKKEAIEHLTLARHWLNWWFALVETGKPIELYAWC